MKEQTHNLITAIMMLMVIVFSLGLLLGLHIANNACKVNHPELYSR